MLMSIPMLKSGSPSTGIYLMAGWRRLAKVLNDLGFDCDVDKLVLSRAKRALQIGCDGVFDGTSDDDIIGAV